MSLVEQELLTLPEHPSSPPVFSGVHVTWSLFFFVMFCRSLFVLFLLAIVWSFLRFTASDYPFGIFTLLAIVLSVLQFMAFNYPFGIFKLSLQDILFLRFIDTVKPAHVVTSIKQSHFSCPVIENFIWIEHLLRGPLS